MMEVVTGVAHPPSGLHHNNKIPPDYTRVEVHTMKPKFMQWKIDYPTPEGLGLLREVMNQFILWHKRDIVLTASSPPVQYLEGLLEEGEILSPSHDHVPEMPHSFPPPREHVHEMPQPMPQSSPPPREHVPKMPRPSLPRKEQEPNTDSIHEQQGPPEEVHAQDGWDKEPKIQILHPITIRPILKLMRDVTSMAKWYAHDQFKPKNQVKKVPTRASEETVTSKVHQTAKKYPNVDVIKWSKDCPEKYERSKNFLPNRIIQCMPLGMRKFHDWYLRAQITELEILQAWIPVGTFGA